MPKRSFSTASNPLGVALDERTGLPAYPADGRSMLLARTLAQTADEFELAIDVLDRRLAEVADEFAETFAEEDKRAATLARIQNTDNAEPTRLHRQRMQRRG